MFSLIVWINGWINNRHAGDLRRYPAHYDVTLMNYLYSSGLLQWYDCPGVIEAINPEGFQWYRSVTNQNKTRSANPARVSCCTVSKFHFESKTKYPSFCRRHFYIHFLVEQTWCILIQISLRFVPMVPSNNKPALLQIVAWRRIGDNPLSETRMMPFIDAGKRHSASMS